MDDFACALIDALGGTTETARLMNAPVTTVQNMKTRRLTASRLDHLRRIAHDLDPPVDVDAIANRFGVDLPPMARWESRSSGKAGEVSGQVVA